MPAPAPTPTLDADEQALYDKVLRIQGQAKADAYKATKLSQKAQLPFIPPLTAPLNLNVRQSEVTPPAPAVPVSGPLGTQIRVPQSSLDQLALNRPSKEKLRQDTLKAAGSFRDKRIVELLSQGKSQAEAEWTANNEAYEKVRLPSSVSGYDRKAVGGYSTLALSGKDTLPFMDSWAAAAEAYKPQALETPEAAKGRKVFDALQVKAKAQLAADAKKFGQSEIVTFNAMFDNNKREAPLLAEQMYGPVDPSAPRAYEIRKEQIEEILAAKNAVLYAIRPDEGFFDINKFASKKAGDAIKFMTEDEKYGVRTETKGVATLRFLGGLSRLGLNAIEASVITPATKAVTAAFDPNITYDDLTKIEEDMVKQAGVVDVPAYSLAGNRVELSDSAKTRSKVDTGNFTRDTMWDIATGRSAVDDYLDTGMDSGVATVLGLMTEFAIPVTPIGWVTDVAPALRVGSGLAAAGRGAGAAFDAAAATKAGQAVGKTRVGQFAGDVVRAAKLIPDLPQIAKIRSYAKANIKEGSDVGKSLKASPKFKDNLADAASLRENLVDLISEEAINIVQKQRLLNEPVRGSSLPDDARIILGDDINPEKISEKIKEVEKSIDTMKNSKIPAVRIAIAEAETHSGSAALLSKERWDLRNKVRAEIINAIPNDDWVFVTDGLLVKKEVAKSKEFIDVVKAETESWPRGITPADARTRLETAIKKSFTGPAEGKAFKGTELAEPLAFDAPRVVGEGTPIVNEFPRGGIERLQTPDARRLTVVEVAQDTRDTLRAIASFAGVGSPYVRKAAKTFQEAVKGRVSADVYRFMLKTKSELDALERAQMNALAGIKANGSTSVLNDAINARVDPKNNNFTIYDDYKVPVNSTDAANQEVVNDMVSFFFDDANLRATFGDDYEKVVRDVIINNSAGVSTLDAYRQSVAALRNMKPQLGGVGIGKRVGTEVMNIDIGAIQWLQSAEAKAIFRKNVREGLPKTKSTVVEYTDAMKGAAANQDVDTMRAVEDFIEKVGDRNVKIMLDKVIDKVAAKYIFDREIDVSGFLDDFKPLQDQLEAELKAIANKAFDDQVQSANKLGAEVPEAANVRLNEALAGASEKAEQIYEDIVITTTKDNLFALEGVFNKQFAASGFDERVAVEKLSNIVDLPLPPQLAHLLRNYFGSVDELKKMRGILGENSTYGIRSVSDSNWSKFGQVIGEVTELASRNAAVGLTAGTVGPNLRYHATNHMAAPLVMALTNPTFLFENAFHGVIAGPLEKAGVPIKKFPFTRGATVASIESGPVDDIAFVSPTGVSYTNGQLAKILNENYFGMTQNEYISAGAKLEDIAREAGAGWKPKTFPFKMIDEGIHYLGVQGTGLWARFAEATDRMWRKQVYITGLANGQTHTQAIQVAKDTFLDYGKIPPDVRQTIGKHMMFFSWMAMHKMEFLRSMLTRNGASNVVKAANAQRDAHREWGQWLYEDDAVKAKLWSDYIGDYGGAPALDVGPDNVMISPLLTTYGPAIHSSTDIISAFTKGPGAGVDATIAAGKTAFNDWVAMAFDPVIAYMRDIKMLGDKGVPDIVPSKSVAWHQAQGNEHFAKWLETTGIEVIPLDERRLGTETFNDMQYKFSNDAAKKRWAWRELVYTYAGLERLISDTQQASIVTGVGLPPGMDRQRWSNTSVADIAKFYLFSASKVKSSDDYEQFRQLMLQAQRDLKADNVARTLSESGK